MIIKIKMIIVMIIIIIILIMMRRNSSVATGSPHGKPVIDSIILRFVVLHTS